MKKNHLRSMIILAAMVFLASVVMIGIRLGESRRGAEEGNAPVQITSDPQPASPPPVSESIEEPYIDPYAEELASTDLAALQEVNADVIGWISIPGTPVNYPLVHGEDNSYYLAYAWNKVYDPAGAVFLECQNASDMSDFNSIIYAHNMSNGSMFGELKKYYDIEFWKEHPSIYIVDSSGVHRYDIFAAHEAGVRTITYGLGITKTETKERFIDFALSNSVIDTEVIPTIDDKLITLSTCTGKGYDTRWVVQGVLNDQAPSWIEE